MKPIETTVTGARSRAIENVVGPQPERDCPLCPRLTALRGALRVRHPEWFNAPVPNFGDVDGRLLIVGLAPGLRGANRTGRPFTGDYAGDLLYGTLAAFGYTRGTFAADPTDGLRLSDVLITNAVRCVPPENKPVAAEIAACRAFFQATVREMKNLRAILALGRLAHETVDFTWGARRASFPFAHAAEHKISANVSLFDSYHCSRYNTNTGRLTEAMFHAVFEKIATLLGGKTDGA